MRLEETYCHSNFSEKPSAHTDVKNSKGVNINNNNNNLLAKKEEELETLVQTIRICSQDIGMEFGIEKCAIFIMKSGKRRIKEGIELQKQERIRTVGKKEN